MEIEIVDTSGEEGKSLTRCASFKDAGCFMICIAANSNLQNLAFWLTEVRKLKPTKPIALILTKADLCANGPTTDQEVQILNMEDIIEM